MRNRLYKKLSLFMVVAMFVALLPVYAVQAEGEDAASTVIHFVNESDPAKISSMSTYLSNSKTYEKAGQSYLRIDVQQVYDVVFTLEGNNGTKVESYTKEVTDRSGAKSEVEFITFDYPVSDLNNVLTGSVSYFVPSYFKEPQSHTVDIRIGNDIDAAKAELTAAIAKAEEISTPGEALTAALEAAKEANHYLTLKADMTAAIDALHKALEEPVATDIRFVNHSDKTKVSSMSTYLSNPRTYVKEGKYYLRIDVQQVYDVEFILEGDKGTKVDSYTKEVTDRSGAKSEVEFATFDYPVADLTEELTGSVSYFVPDYFKEPQSHTVNVLIGDGVNPSFNDVTTHWANGAIIRTASLGIVTGYEDGSFKPGANITRAEFTALIARAFKLEAAKNETVFADASSIQPWAKAIIQNAVAAEIVKGFDDQTFRPAAHISRTDMTVMIVRALGVELVSENELTFDDASSIPAYAKASVATAVKHSLINGLGGNQFGGSKQATRAEAVTILHRTLEFAAAQAEQE